MSGRKPYLDGAHERRIRKRGFRFIAGVDEAGRGPLAGPVVAAAVILNKHEFNARIDDSKRLSATARLEAYNEITSHSIYNISVIYQNVIDEINIYNATKLAIVKAVAGLTVKPDYLLVDGKVAPALHCDSLAIKKGDSVSLSIACASIVAKVSRDNIMLALHRIFPEYGFNRHKGYCTERHIKMLKTYGPSPVHRFSYQPVKSADLSHPSPEVSRRA